MLAPRQSEASSPSSSGWAPYAPVDVDIDTLEARLRAEVTAQAGIQLLPAIVGAWSHT